uniref:Uncharacterized protein n=1 Tax=Panagrolaimus sp. PS1159 TaxID=55785 RepID=A0AC35GS04_9BILA
MSSSSQITPNLSVEEVLEILSKNDSVFDGEVVTVNKLKSSPVVTLISEGKGFCSFVYRIELSTDKNDYSFVAK